MSSGNAPPNTETPNFEYSTSFDTGSTYINDIETASEASSRVSNLKERKDEEFYNSSCHGFLRTQIDTDSDNVKLESDRDYKSVAGVVIRDCGEPFKPQVLRIDFDPLKGVDDDDFVQNKCVAFWKFIDDHPELNSLKVKAKKESVTKDSFTHMTPTENESSTSSSESSEGFGLTPITMMTLDWLKNGDLMTHALATKAVTKPCELVSNYEKYSQNKPDDWPSGRKPDVAKLRRVPCTDSKSRAQISNKISQDNSLTLLMAEMNRWDSQHPNSMKPPNNPPELIIEKPELILPYIATNRDTYCEECLN